MCIRERYEIVAEAPFWDYFEWYIDGEFIDSTEQNSLIVTETGEYSVIVYDEQCGSSAQDTVQINLFSESYAYTTDDIITCDDSSNDGIENFDLSIQNENILGGQDPNEYLVTYYETLQDAQSGNNALSINYTNTSNPQQIYARVEHVDAIGSNSGCFSTVSYTHLRAH